ncbi:hypothetical protein ABH15_08855 [Methanoculleus taiwanensis]|uniref:FAS1 domain-containing protein n=1 Tax=Methanoculleus taiwanensis TaxID=1550565 RepID=A0A498H2A3_9EURY|nr:fasciclin domain-containing protein [Methanoculleus taiwanensis]RXE56240.1 hypothetical protein ABH15_08855 [Methanoculleus taiwanensis]
MKNIIETAKDDGRFNTLLKAIDAAGLTETLSNQGPFTVFAPTNGAFNQIPKDQLNSILSDKEQLSAILKYHVVSGKMMASDVTQQNSIQTLEGDSLTIDTSQGTVRVNNARITETDIECTNGVCHVIDSVLVPKKAEVPAQR